MKVARRLELFVSLAVGLLACRPPALADLDGGLVARVNGVAFGRVVLGTTASRSVSVRNVSRVELAFSPNVPEPFGVEPGRVAVAAGAEVLLPVRFTPSAVGRVESTLVLASEQAGEIRLPVIGEGLACAGDAGVCGLWQAGPDRGCESVPRAGSCRTACIRLGVCAGFNCEGERASCGVDTPCSVGVCDDVRGCLRQLRCANQPECTTAVCLDDGGCEFSPLPEGAACETTCVVSGVCRNAKCVGVNRDCSDGNRCTADSCEPDSGCVHEDVSMQCPVAFESCRQATCDPQVGCTTVAAADDTPCGQVQCYQESVCSSGQCVTRSVDEGVCRCDASQGRPRRWGIGQTFGEGATCRVLNDGGVECWGLAHLGLLGGGVRLEDIRDAGFPNDGVPTPVAVPLPSGVGSMRSLAMERPQICAHSSDDRLWCWGLTERCDAADGGLYNSYTVLPGPVLRGHARVYAADNEAHSWAMLDAGVLAQRGRREGAYPAGSAPPAYAFRGTCDNEVLPLAADFVELAVGTSVVCGLRPDGRVVCWGVPRRAYGAEARRSRFVWPQYLTLSDGGVLRDVVELSPRCWRTKRGELYCDGLQFRPVLEPWGVPTDAGFAAFPALRGICVARVSAENLDTGACVVTQDGGVVCVGPPVLTNALPPRTPGDLLLGPPYISAQHFLPGAEDIAIGWGRACASLSDGGFRCWGSNQFGELGDGTYTDRFAP